MDSPRAGFQAGSGRVARGLLVAVVAAALPALLGAAPAQGNGESALPYLFAAYVIIWAGVFGYLFFISRKQGELKREIEALRRSLGEREGPGAR